MEGYRFTLEQPVVWRDLDSLAHVNNAVYATYFETGRIEYAAQILGGYEQIRNMILADLNISYKSPAFLGETMVIGVRVSEIKNSSFVMESQILEKRTGRPVATSRAVLVCYDYDKGRAQPVPDTWRQALGSYEGRDFSAKEA